MQRLSRKLPADVKEVLQLVQAGKLFALQEWIKAGKPVRPTTGGKSDSVVLRTAVETGFHSVVEELLRAGGWSPKDLTNALALARDIRQFDIAALLAGKGAQPRQATFRTSCEKLDLFMMEHLLRGGADPNQENVFADVLNSIKARPLLRFFRQLRGEFPALEDQAALALAEAVKNRQVRWTAFLRWAGADPFRPVPNDLSEPFPADPENHTTAVREAAWCGNPEILKVLHLKPTPDQAVQMLGHISYANNFKLFQTLLDAVPKDLINDTPRGSSSALEHLVRRWPHSDMPAKASPDKLFQIPTPFNYLADHWENTDQSKWIDLIERQSVKGGVRDIRRDGSAHGIDDFAPADGLAANPRRDGIPVYERKRRTVVVHGDPRSTAGFRRRDYVATAHFLLFGRETSGARQFFVAVHPQAIASLSRDERDGTHCMNQSAAG